MRFTHGALDYYEGPITELDWQFPAPFGHRRMVADFTMADVVTVPSHLAVPEVRTCMAVEAASDLSRAETPAPEAVDSSGRSDQTFVVEVVVTADGVERRATASGQDIYAITAPLAVEAVERILTGRTRTTGVGLGRCHVRRGRLPPRPRRRTSQRNTTVQFSRPAFRRPLVDVS